MNSISMKKPPDNGMHKLGKYLNYAPSRNLFFCDFLPGNFNIQMLFDSEGKFCYKILLFMWQKHLQIYSYLNASIGSKRDALTAG